MARQSHGLEDFLGYTSTPEWRSAIFSAALSFAALHVIVMMTPALSLDAAGNATALVPQLAHIAAVILRLLVPLSCLCVGFVQARRRRRQTVQRRS